MTAASPGIARVLHQNPLLKYDFVRDLGQRRRRPPDGRGYPRHPDPTHPNGLPQMREFGQPEIPTK